MKTWITSLLAKWLGPTFLGRISTSAITMIIANLTKWGFDASQIDVERWSQDTSTIVSWVLGLFIGGLIDLKLSKNDIPQTPELVKK